MINVNITVCSVYVLALDPKGIHKTTRPDALKKCAAYVQVLHTNNFIGNKHQIGHADFYANGGSFQPECVKQKDQNECSHFQSLVIFIASLEATFEAYDNSELSTSTVTYGIRADRKRSGKFYFNTEIDDNEDRGEELKCIPKIGPSKRVLKTLADPKTYKVF